MRFMTKLKEIRRKEEIVIIRGQDRGIKKRKNRGNSKERRSQDIQSTLAK